MSEVQRATTTINKCELLELSDDELALLAGPIGILPKLVALSKRFHDLFAPILQILKPLARAPFRIPFKCMDSRVALWKLGQGITDDDMSTFSRAVSKGALASLKILDLGSNKIGDPGTTALADALGKGALPKCTSILMVGNPASDAARQAVKDAIASRK